MKYDIIIIGSGFGGLVCANLLSKVGKNVLVLERQAQTGGCIQSYRRKNFSFDTGLHYVGGLSEGQPLYQIFHHLGLMQLPWHRLSADGFDLITIDNQTFAFAEGYDNFVRQLSASFPSEREALAQYAKLLKEASEMPLGSEGVYRLMETNAYDYLTETFHDSLLINVLSGSALKMELRKPSLPLFTFAHGNSSFIQSSWRLRGEGNMIVQSLSEGIQANGGTILRGKEAQELVENDGKITAVKCQDGEVYEANTFISDIHPAQTFSLVKDSKILKRLYRQRIAMLENTYGMFTVSLVLKPQVLRYFNHNKYVYRKANVWSFFEEDQHVGGLMVSCRVPLEGDYARQLDLLTPMPWSLCAEWEHTQVGHRGDEYKAMKQQLADRCIDLAETVIPGLRSMIAEQYTSTPLTYRDYTLTPNGSAYGIRKDCRNLLMTMLSPKTPIPNLLLTGQNLMLHGLEGVSMTALQTCSELLGKDYIQTIIKT